jgi:hypothetical protein
MSEKNKEYTFNDPKELSKLIKTIESVEVVKDCKEWDWESRFPDFESAFNMLLKQLKMQRELLLLSIVWQRNSLLDNAKTKEE